MDIFAGDQARLRKHGRLSDREGAHMTSVDVPAQAPFSSIVEKGQALSIIDLGGNQAVDFLVYDAADTTKRYHAQTTIAMQGNIFLTTGSVLRTAEGAPLMTVIA